MLSLQGPLSKYPDQIGRECRALPATVRGAFVSSRSHAALGAACTYRLPHSENSSAKVRLQMSVASETMRNQGMRLGENLVSHYESATEWLLLIVLVTGLPVESTGPSDYPSEDSTLADRSPSAAFLSSDCI